MLVDVLVLVLVLVLADIDVDQQPLPPPQANTGSIECAAIAIDRSKTIPCGHTELPLARGSAVGGDEHEHEHVNEHEYVYDQDNAHVRRRGPVEITSTSY